MNRISDAVTLKRVVKDAAVQAGFDVVGIASADVFRERGDTAKERVSEGLMDGLPWFTEQRIERGMNPANMLDGARSIISLALSHHHEGDAEALDSQPRGRIARYAWGEDYHRVFARKVRAFIETLPEITGVEDIGTRWYTDTGPMLDRAVAERAGVGWFGKNTNILTPQGSWMLLAQIITTLDLTPDEPLKKTCGVCNICVDACPTGAIIAPYVLDNRKCISYLTIENRGPIPRELRPFIGDWIFGCDVCQDVCPVNRKAQVGKAYTELTRDAENRARPELVELLELDDDGFRERFRQSAVLRAKPEGMRRNVCIALGNIADPATVPPLARVLSEDPSPIVRGHAAWALGRIRTTEAMEALDDALQKESGAGTLEEIELALKEAG
ncbi:MAG: tRNA epoxyqueuosine(34) reductase QueG [Dehalococcoidia bacterium]|nr:tRNA epoxyqueuosine(34) reductase QueG [Dehalococcoidia bacterium]